MALKSTAARYPQPVVSVIKRMDHAGYVERCKRRSLASLYYVMRDATEAAEAMPDGPNVQYYMDEAIYCGQEIVRRQQQPK